MEHVWEQFNQALKQPKQGEQENVILEGETTSQQYNPQSKPPSQQNIMLYHLISKNTPLVT